MPGPTSRNNTGDCGPVASSTGVGGEAETLTVAQDAESTPSGCCSRQALPEKLIKPDPMLSYRDSLPERPNSSLQSGARNRSRLTGYPGRGHGHGHGYGHGDLQPAIKAEYSQLEMEGIREDPLLSADGGPGGGPKDLENLNDFLKDLEELAENGGCDLDDASGSPGGDGEGDEDAEGGAELDLTIRGIGLKAEELLLTESAIDRLLFANGIFDGLLFAPNSGNPANTCNPGNPPIGDVPLPEFPSHASALAAAGSLLEEQRNRSPGGHMEHNGLPRNVGGDSRELNAHI